MTTNTLFESALTEVLGIEGGFSDVDSDRGGKTNWGISERVARSSGYDGEMNALPLSLAKEIYLREYWDHGRLKLIELSRLSSVIAAEIFEQAVNTGVTLTAKRVQRTLNILNRDEKSYPDLVVDGWLGQKTRKAINYFVRTGTERYLLQWLNVAQGKHYYDLCESDPTQEIFARGWVDKRVKV
jgi:lysozyme family protein